MQGLRSFYNPSMYQGWGKRRRYFEGWYYKLIDKSGHHAMAIIPGIAMDESGGKQAFIQILDGINKQSEYIKFDAGSFSASRKRFEVTIADNIFSASELVLNHNRLKGHLRFSNIKPWPVHLFSPGIMGPFAFVPFMECYHGVVSMDHDIEGTIHYGGRDIEFTKGKGYTEKDWGRSFPSAYIWMQSNNFEQKKVSVKLSVAKIPWLASSFTGFIAGVMIGNELYRFTTYNRSRLLRSMASEKTVDIELQSPRYSLKVTAHRDGATSLASPILGVMEGRIEESMTCRMKVELKDRRSGSMILDSEGHNTALEVAGRVEEILI